MLEYACMSYVVRTIADLIKSPIKSARWCRCENRRSSHACSEYARFSSSECSSRLTLICRRNFCSVVRVLTVF